MIRTMKNRVIALGMTTVMTFVTSTTDSGHLKEVSAFCILTS